MHFDVSNAGMGDAVTAAWIAEGWTRAGKTVTFKGGRNRRVLELLGQTVTEEPYGIDLGEKGVWQYELATAAMQQVAVTHTTAQGSQTTIRRPLDLPSRPILWQRVLPEVFAPVRPTPTVDRAGWKAAEGLLHAADMANIVLLFPMASYNTRTWPKDYWLRLAWELEQHGACTFAFDGCEQNVKDFPRYCYGFGIDTLAAAVLMSDLVIGNDSGPAHLAGTLDVRTIGIIGACDPSVVWGHLDSVYPMRASEEKVPCVGCHFQHSAGFNSLCDRSCQALSAVQPHDVAKAAIRILEGHYEPRRHTETEHDRPGSAGTADCRGDQETNSQHHRDLGQ